MSDVRDEERHRTQVETRPMAVAASVSHCDCIATRMTSFFWDTGKEGVLVGR